MKRVADAVGVGLLVMVVAWGLFLYRHNEPPRPLFPFPRVGASVPPLRGVTLEGRQTTIHVDRPLVIYAFTVDCVWCPTNVENARRLSEQVAGRYRFVAVALNDRDLPQYLARHSLRWEVVKDLPEEVVFAYGLGSAPLTVVIDGHGTVVHAWWGPYTSDVQLQIQEVLKVRLPGVVTRDQLPTRLGNGRH